MNDTIEAHRILSATDLGLHWNLLFEIPTYLPLKIS